MREISYLQKLDEVLQAPLGVAKAPALVFQEADLSVRVLRDVFLSEFEKAIIDSPKQFERVTNFFQRTAPELVGGVELYEGKKPLFEKWKINQEIESTLNRRVDLPSGGYLIIDYTEALTVIDVNSGSFTGRGKGGSRKRSPKSTPRRRMRPYGSCGCATSAASSSSISSTWPEPATATKS